MHHLQPQLQHLLLARFCLFLAAGAGLPVGTIRPGRVSRSYGDAWA